jgi:hypothetical protein
LKDCWRSIFADRLASPSREVGADFLPSHHVDTEPGVTFPIELQREEAFVLLDATEDESDAGDELPEEVVEYTEGLSGRTEDTEIQSCSIDSLLQPFQSPLDVNSLRGLRDLRGLQIMLTAAGAKELRRKSDLGMERSKRPNTVTVATFTGVVHRGDGLETERPLMGTLDFEIHLVGLSEF